MTWLRWVPVLALIILYVFIFAHFVSWAWVRPRVRRWRMSLAIALVPTVMGGGPVVPVGEGGAVTQAGHPTGIAGVAPLVVSDAVQLLQTAEKGWTTTEFWVTVITMLIGLLVTLGAIHVDVGDPRTVALVQSLGGLAALVIPAAVYALGRSLRKQHTQG